MDAGDREDVVPGQGVRRTFLANERTFLAWWRSGLTALGVALAVGRLIPDLTNATRWPYTIVGVSYAVLGIAFVVYGARRRREVDAAIRSGGFAPADERAMAAFGVFTSVIAVATLVLLLTES